MRAWPVALALLAGACTARIGVTDDGAEVPASDDACVAAPCHDAVARQMEHGSSHAVLLRCQDCHRVRSLDPTRGHASSPFCSDCHSQANHEGVRCDDCHAPHGTSNAFLLRETLRVDADRVVLVRVVRPEGATWSGLARAGVPGAPAGTGFCEVCHEDTRYYDRAGTGEPHDGAWCSTCHPHDLGFHTPPG